MWTNLKPEIRAFRRHCFSNSYLSLFDSLGVERKLQFLQLENLFLDLVSYFAARQERDGHWNAQPFPVLITAHAMRLLHTMGIPLKAKWNLAQHTRDSNLFRASRYLLDQYRYRPPKPDSTACWGDDFWDDCHVLLALLQVRDDWDQRTQREFETKYRASEQWLVAQIQNDLRQQAKRSWFGPAFHAAGIDLFSHPFVQKHCSNANSLITELAKAAGPMLRNSLRQKPWDERFAWHAGQFIVTWANQPALRLSNVTINQLTNELVSRQNKRNGTWDSRGVVREREDKIYYTVRALTAFYVRQLVPSETVDAAHDYLLRTARKTTAAEAPLVDLKACVNAVEALQKLFGFRIQNVYPLPLLSLVTRLNFLGLSETIAKPVGRKIGTLKAVRTAARVELENDGESGAELVGVNYRLYDDLKRNYNFLDEFTGDPDYILKELKRFLSSTLTETRCRSSRQLIKSLWTTHGFLNFMPLIAHLSDLEQDRAFYKYYRDHLNHEVLLFMLGAYIYFNCRVFKNKINEEIARTYDGAKSLNDDAAEREFLFRWKLISTFHDIGYLFEVDPDSSTGKKRLTKELLKRSFALVEALRQEFLLEYLMQYMPDADEEKKRTEAQSLIRKLRLQPYRQRIEKAEDLFSLRMAGARRNAFEMIDEHISGPHIPHNFVRCYFELCRKTEVLKPAGETARTEFLDHGIMSALVLLKTADIQRHYLGALWNHRFRGKLPQQLRRIFDRQTTQDQLDPDQFFVRFSHVAGAIALHNIAPRLYNKKQCREFDRKNRRGGIKLEDAFYKPIGRPGRYGIDFDENPLAYLTALADTLQDWDRHSFRRSTFGEDSDEPLSSSEVIIDCKNDVIHVRGLTESACQRYQRNADPATGFQQYLINWERYVQFDGRRH